jgi:hypothetical protein
MFTINKIGDTECEISNFVSDGSPDLVIPQVLSGLTVTRIKSEAFFNCVCMGDLVIPDTVEVIESFAFSSGLFKGKLTLGSRVRRIEANAFWMCKFTGPLLLPPSLEYIGVMAFYWCGFTGRLKIPNKVRMIDDAAFSKCKFISLSFDDLSGLRSIGEWAFADNPLRGDVTFPDSLQNMGRKAFLDCDDIEMFVNAHFDKNESSSHYDEQNAT